LQTLLRVVSTAAPLPNDALACMESHPSHTARPHPICSPLFVTAHMYPTLVPGSRNITWLARILAHGLPQTLMARLNVFDEHGGVDVQKRSVEWDGLLAKLVAQIGLTTLIGTAQSAVKQPSLNAPLPSLISVSNGDNNRDRKAENGTEGEDNNGDDSDVPTGQNDLQSEEPHDVDPSSSSDDSDFQPECDSTSESDDEGRSEIDGDEVFGTLATPATTSLDGVRRLARIRVYNMAYLHPSRAFGPFLPIDKRSSRPSFGPGFFADAEEDQGAEGSSTGAPSVPPIPESSFFLGQVSDPDPDDNEDDNLSTEQADGDDEGEDAVSSSSLPVPGDQLRFDWAWIAAARQVVELNLRDLLMTRHRDVLRALISLEGLRPCSVPGLPLTVPDWSAAEGEGSGNKGMQYRDGEGWDWAGVEGQWRYVIVRTPVSH
jgi:hypothetical protein